MLAYGLTNPTLQRLLRQESVAVTEGTLWDSFVRAIAELLGIEVKDLSIEQRNALSALLMVGDDLLMDEQGKQSVIAIKKPKESTKKIIELKELKSAILALGGINRQYTNEFSDYFKDKKYYKVFKVNGGDSLDGMAENLRQYGFDYDGGNSLQSALWDSLNGMDIYTPNGYAAQLQAYYSSKILDESGVTGEEFEFIKQVSELINNGVVSIEELDDTHTIEEFDNLLAKSTVLTKDEASDFWGLTDVDQQSENASTSLPVRSVRSCARKALLRSPDRL